MSHLATSTRTPSDDRPEGKPVGMRIRVGGTRARIVSRRWRRDLGMWIYKLDRAVQGKTYWRAE